MVSNVKVTSDLSTFSIEEVIDNGKWLSYKNGKLIEKHSSNWQPGSIDPDANDKFKNFLKKLREMLFNTPKIYKR
ncbi:hypothetical protein PBR_0887 [Segatella baroniae B14]|uniref:Uncharacterized protein n=2 Tax=Segatella TaxID=2974251 RepID=D8DW26_9BACT|nr:hypothetical protein PBR_0887 [Segatella baroniae B14]GJG28904.1 hypothetical protein PRRU23_26040 [Segatella bryantii]